MTEQRQSGSWQGRHGSGGQRRRGRSKRRCGGSSWRRLIGAGGLRGRPSSGGVATVATSAGEWGLGRSIAGGWFGPHFLFTVHPVFGRCCYGCYAYAMGVDGGQRDSGGDALAVARSVVCSDPESRMHRSWCVWLWGWVCMRIVRTWGGGAYCLACATFGHRVI